MRKQLEKIINKQFEMIGAKITWSQIPESGIIKEMVKKKEVEIFWWEKWQFESEAQYKEWEKWAKEELKKDDLESEWVSIFLLYSLNFPWKKGKGSKGQQLVLNLDV